MKTWSKVKQILSLQCVQKRNNPNFLATQLIVVPDTIAAVKSNCFKLRVSSGILLSDIQNRARQVPSLGEKFSVEQIFTQG